MSFSKSVKCRDFLTIHGYQFATPPPPPPPPAPQKKKFDVIFTPCASAVSLFYGVISILSTRYQIWGLLSGKLFLCSVKLELMALKNLMVKCYRYLHEVCTTFGARTDVQLDGMLFTHSFLTTNQCRYFTLNKLKDQLCSFTSLSFVSERKVYKIYPPSCVVRQNMAMICGQKTMLPSCVARQNMAMISDIVTDNVLHCVKFVEVYPLVVCVTLICDMFNYVQLLKLFVVLQLFNLFITPHENTPQLPFLCVFTPVHWKYYLLIDRTHFINLWLLLVFMSNHMFTSRDQLEWNYWLKVFP